MNKVELTHGSVTYRLLGSGKTTLVIQTALMACSAEWWHIAEDLSKDYQVLVFDRPGYGKSSPFQTDRTPENIVKETLALLDALGITEKVVFIGHSQGGLYSMDFSLRYPNRVKALLLLDPLTPYDEEFHQVLSEEEYRNSGIDKLAAMKLGKTLTGLGLGFLFKSMLKKSPPFFYRDFSKEATSYILYSLTKKNGYVTAIEEYIQAHKEHHVDLVAQGIATHALKDLPILLMTHSSAVYLKEMAHYSGLSPEAALRMEEKWQEIMKRCRFLSNKNLYREAPNSGHFIHLTDYELFKAAVYEIAEHKCQ